MPLLQISFMNMKIRRLFIWVEQAQHGGPVHLGEMIFILHSYEIFYCTSIEKFGLSLEKYCFDHTVFKQFYVLKYFLP